MKLNLLADYEQVTHMFGDLTESHAARFVGDLERHREMLDPLGYRALLESQEQSKAYTQLVKGSISNFSGLAHEQDILKSIMASGLVEMLDPGHRALVEWQEQSKAEAQQVKESISNFSGLAREQEILKTATAMVSGLAEALGSPGHRAMVEWQEQSKAEAQVKESISNFSGLAREQEILKTATAMVSGLVEMRESPGPRAMVEWQERTNADARQIKESIGAFFGLTAERSILKLMNASVDYSMHSPSTIEHALRALQQTVLPVGDAFTSALLGQARSVGTLNEFEQTFAGRLITRAREVVEAPDENIEERVEKLSQLIRGQIASSKRSVISTEAWVQIIIAVVFHLLSMRATDQSEARVLSHLQDIETQLKAVTAIHKVDQRRDLQLVAAKLLRIRAEPRADAAVVGKLTQNALVRLLDEQRYWAYVEYFDYLDGKTKEGWVSKRHLKNLPDEFVK